MFLLLHIRKTLLQFTRNPSLVQKSSVNLNYFSTSKLKCESTVAPISSSVVSDFLLEKHQISPDVASRATSALAHVNDTEKLASVISFLTDTNGFSQTQLEALIKSCPALLVADVDKTLKPKFDLFKDSGFSPSEIAGIFSNAPWILAHSLSNRIAPALAVLNTLLGSHAHVVKLLMISGSDWLFTDLEKTLVPNIQYLTTCGVPMDQIHRLLYRNFRFLSQKPQLIKQAVDRAERLGADRSSELFLHTVKVIGSMSEKILERKVQGLHELGLSESDILMVLRKQPDVFSLSLGKVSTIKEVLLATGKYTMESIINYPRALTVSKKIYKPRVNVLEVLERKNLIKEWPSLSTLGTMTDDQFFKAFVAPHGNAISELWPKFS